MSLYDTVYIIKGEVKSCHGVGVFFKDSEIHKLFPSSKCAELGGNIKADLLKNGKVVIQQQAVRACTAAAAAMLIYDNGGRVNTHLLRSTNLADTSDMILWINESGLKTRVTLIQKEFSVLVELVKQYGSAIIDFNKDIGGHVIIVDGFSENHMFVYIRDPYHGWAISVTKRAFMSGFTSGKAIQVVQ